VEGPFIRIEESGTVLPLRPEVTTIGRGRGVDIRLDEPSVSRLHAELVRRGPYVYVISFGAARCRMGGIPREDVDPDVELRRAVAPDLTRREIDVLTSLCRPALSDEAFVAPATAREIATDLVVTEAAVKQHLLRLYDKFGVYDSGERRRVRLANEAIRRGAVTLADLRESSAG
jgi:DNA-binding transcriptional ArsR family regulator